MWNYQPGDRLIVTVADRVVTEDEAIYLRRRIIDTLQLPSDFPIAFTTAEIRIAVHRDYPVSAEGGQWVVPQ